MTVCGGSWGKITHAWVPLYPGAKQHRKPQELFAKAVSFWRLPSLQHDWVGIKISMLSWVLYKSSSSSWKQKGGLLSSYGTIFNRSVEEGYAPESPWFLAKYERFGKFLRAASWRLFLQWWKLQLWRPHLGNPLAPLHSQLRLSFWNRQMSLSGTDPVVCKEKRAKFLVGIQSSLHSLVSKKRERC